MCIIFSSEFSPCPSESICSLDLFSLLRTWRLWYHLVFEFLLNLYVYNPTGTSGNFSRIPWSCSDLFAQDFSKEGHLPFRTCVFADNFWCLPLSPISYHSTKGDPMLRLMWWVIGIMSLCECFLLSPKSYRPPKIAYYFKMLLWQFARDLVA